MRKEPKIEGPEQLPQGASDMEMAVWLSGHIDKPCEVEIAPGKVADIREFYLGAAREYLPRMTDASAREFLTGKIEEYEKSG
ncbi:MAG: hypothetical protein A2946_00405 [Candidatus Liptonbacteria bacterium RIFCSPLOWO2_01_FULL_53_13]|uniref:Uncharacterized protein n=1 Tax=Candidatus Liptonbacteria bacterium RIFCSPLOWO2_01_FULL_53_13 TaxID=1798651 RepID=A0A1G2CIB1_9BACT|nr:MAG: hypothetical protein A2946_00405 [Candidatus Liptonbacteria bacterium RIFCSPLOWO2_01_FULL_53_13]